MTNEELFISKLAQKIIDLAYRIVEWDQNEKNDKNRGQSNYKRDIRNEQVAGAGEKTATITKVSRAYTRKDGIPMVVIESKTEDGEKLANKYYSFNSGGVYYCKRDFMDPLGLTELVKNFSIEDYEDFDFESYEGKTMKVLTDFNDKGQLEITKFLEVVEESPDSIKVEEVPW